MAPSLIARPREPARPRPCQAVQLNKEMRTASFDLTARYPILIRDNCLRRNRGTRQVTPSLCLDNHQQFVLNPGRASIQGILSGQHDNSPRMRSMPARNKKPATTGAKRSRGAEGAAGQRSASGARVHALAVKEPKGVRTDAGNRLPLLPLRSDVVFPQTVVPLVINRPSGIRLVDDVLIGERLVGLVSQLHPEIDEPALGDLYPTICVGTILKMLKFPDGSTRIVCQGQSRARLVRVVQTAPYLIGEVEPLEEVLKEGVELDALVHHVNKLFQRMVDQSQQIPEELQVAAMNTREPGRLADLLGSSLPFSIEEKQSLLAEVDVRVRLEKLGQFLARQLAVL